MLSIRSTVLAAALLGLVTGAAQAAGTDYANSSSYNSGIGMNAGQENQAVNGSQRDGNGNLLIVNGILNGSGSFNRQEGLTQSGAGTGANATAIGNSLNVTVQGNWNTVIVDSTQTNTGSQSANASLNGALKF